MMSSANLRLAQTALSALAFACGCSAEVIDEADLAEDEVESIASSPAALGVARGGVLAPDKLVGAPVAGPGYPMLPGVGPYPGALQYGGAGLPFGGYPGPAGFAGAPFGGYPGPAGFAGAPFGGYPGPAGFAGAPFGGYPGPAGFAGAPFGPGAYPGYPGAVGGVL
jgi:hypothetical protein